jgi:hypothetical protein
MSAKVVELKNTIHWDHQKDDKVYLDKVKLSLNQFPFAIRQVSLRFANGPEFEFSTFDMDRLVLEYLKLRGVRLPDDLCNLTNAKAPPGCDFVVPREVMRSSQSSTRVEPPRVGEMPAGNRRDKNCSRCGQTKEYSGEWYRDFCPACADETEGKWVCRYCKREGNFEEMGGTGMMNPICCGALCDQIKRDAV